jgi:D-serine deaminase-like pyridoxal phosphate-dependent protein
MGEDAMVIGRSLYDLDTPCLLVDLDVLAGNVERVQRAAEAAGLSLRPHIKTHKTPQVALLQMRAGALGVTASKVSEAEVFAAAGIEDIFIANQIVGPQKVRRLAALARYVPRLAVAVDSLPGAQGLSEVFAGEGREIGVLLELNGGAERCGVLPEALLPLAEQVAGLPGLRVQGLFAYAGPAYAADDREACAREECRLLSEQAERLRQAGFNMEIVSGGCTPTALLYPPHSGLTEVRPGSYTLNDRNLVDLGACTEAQVAATILATVVSVPAADRAICDAGSKSLAAMPTMVGPSFGRLWGRPEGDLYSLNEEHGFLHTGALAEKPRVGDKLRLIPSRIGSTLNLYEEMVVISQERVVDVWRIAARGANQ